MLKLYRFKLAFASLNAGDRLWLAATITRAVALRLSRFYELPVSHSKTKDR